MLLCCTASNGRRVRRNSSRIAIVMGVGDGLSAERVESAWMWKNADDVCVRVSEFWA